MNWNAVTALAELVGATAVVASLLYLAAQVRQNTRTVRSATFQSIIGLATGFAESISRDADLARIFHSGMADLDSLSELEQFRFHFHMITLLRRFENAYYQSAMGLVQDEHWEGLRASFRQMISQPGSREWWSRNSHLFNPSFRANLESWLRQPPEVRAPTAP